MNRFAFIGGIIVGLLLLMAFARSAEHEHPPEHLLLHEQFYKTWNRLDFLDASCCNKNDCFPSPMRQGPDGSWWTLKQHIALELDRQVARGEDPEFPPLPAEGENEYTAKWLRVPENVLEHNSLRTDLGVKFPREPRPSPDGRSHACINNNKVLCAVIGEGG